MLDTYRFWMAETTPEPRLILLLYDRAQRLLEDAESALTTMKYDIANEALLKAQRVLEELDCSLDYDRGGEVARNLHNLYSMLLHCLVDANLKKSVELVNKVHRAIASLRETWESVVDQRNRDKVYDLQRSAKGGNGQHRP